jgi:hypothetical protein
MIRSWRAIRTSSCSSRYRKYTPPRYLGNFDCRTRAISQRSDKFNSFTGQVKLYSILVRTSPSDSAPRTLKVFNNRDDLDFASAEQGEGTQAFALSQTAELQELPVKRARFSNVQRLSLFFPDNYGDGDEDVTRITYLGFKGEWMRLGRAPTTILYEAAANPNDHPLKNTEVNQMGNGVGGA